MRIIILMAITEAPILISRPKMISIKDTGNSRNEDVKSKNKERHIHTVKKIAVFFRIVPLKKLFLQSDEGGDILGMIYWINSDILFNYLG